MKIKIDINGNLSIFRSTDSKYIEQWCPFSQRKIRCGEECPLFNIFSEIRQDNNGKNYDHSELRLCQKNYYIDGLEYD